VIFRNPAQIIGTRSTLDLSLARLGPASRMVSSGAVYAAGPRSLTLGWGVQIVGFSASATASYPYSPDLTLESGSRNGTSLLVTLGGALVIKGFRVGAAGKYVSDIVAMSPAVLNPVRVNQHRVWRTLESREICLGAPLRSRSRTSVPTRGRTACTCLCLGKSRWDGLRRASPVRLTSACFPR
jgi:hypothetical protein